MTTTLAARILLTAKDQTGPALKAVRGNMKGLGRAVTGLHTQLLALTGVGGLGLFLDSVIDVNMEMQTLKSSLETVTGSAEQAEVAFGRITDFAKSTPYNLDEVVGAFIKLKAIGLDPSEAALKSYGNTASAMGKSLNQMIEAVADAATGEFERLKEFGIKAKSQKDMVTFTFQGVSTTVKKNAEEITAYLQSIGRVQFAGAMSNQMNNLKTVFSNFRGEMDLLKVTIGEAGLNDAIAGIVLQMTEFVRSLDKDQVRQFTQATLSNFADLLDGIDNLYRYISGNEFLQAGGIVGYALFGKWGIGGALAIDKVNTWMAEDLAKNWAYLNPSEVTGQRDVKNLNPNYRLGDFNAAQGQPDYQHILDRIAERQGKPTTDELRRQTSVLHEIAETLRNPQPAVAG